MRIDPRSVGPPAAKSAFSGVESELISYAPGLRHRPLRRRGWCAAAPAKHRRKHRETACAESAARSLAPPREFFPLTRIGPTSGKLTRPSRSTSAIQTLRDAAPEIDGQTRRPAPPHNPVRLEDPSGSIEGRASRSRKPRCQIVCGADGRGDGLHVHVVERRNIAVGTRFANDFSRFYSGGFETPGVVTAV